MNTTLLLLSLGLPLSAQINIGGTTWTGKFEFTQDQYGRQTYDFQNYGQVGQVSLLVRGFWTENGVHRIETGGGKTIPLFKNADGKPRLSLTPYAGLTTDGAAFTPLVASFNFFGRQAYFLADPKFYHARDNPLHQNTLYQEASVPLTKAGGWQLGWRRLQVNGQVTAFNRIGIERRIWTRNGFSGESSHASILPFFDAHIADPKSGRWSKSVGLYVNFLWQ